MLFRAMMLWVGLVLGNFAWAVASQVLPLGGSYLHAFERSWFQLVALLIFVYIQNGSEVVNGHQQSHRHGR